MSVLAQPAWLLALLVVPVGLVLALAGERGGRRRLRSLTGPELAPRLAERPPGWVAWARALGVWVFVVFAVLALARPRWGRETTPIATRGADLLVLVDVSRSMDVTDVAPSRLELARAFVSALGDRPAGDRVGLVAFAGAAHLLCPLTVDRGALELFLETLDTSLVPEPGTDLGRAIAKGVELLEGAPGEPMMVIVSDGETLSGDPLAEARAAADAGIRVHTVGVGTPAGEPVPLIAPDGSVAGYQKDDQGQVVTSRLDERTLRAIADATGGLYVPLSAGGSAVGRLADEIAAHGSSERSVGGPSRRPERFQWPLAVALVALLADAMLALGARARAARPLRASVLLVLLGSVGAGPVDWVDPPAALNREGNAHYRAGRFEDAQRSYSEGNARAPGRPELLYNLGNALARQGDPGSAATAYREALEAGPSPELAPDLWYNLGNTLLEGEQRDEAVAAYRRTLMLDPDHADARRNLEILLTREEPPPPPPQPQPQESDEPSDPDEPPTEPPPPRPDESRDPDDRPPDAPPPEPDPRATPQGPEPTREQVEQLLEAFEQMEREEMQEREKQRGVAVGGGRDW